MRKKSIPSLSGKSILIHGHTFMGDALMTTPFLSHLKKNKKVAKISVISDQGGLEVYKRLSFVDSVLKYSEESLQQHLQSSNFDCSFVLKDTFKEAFRSRKLSIPIRCGFRKEGAGLLLTHSIKPRLEHGAVKYFRLLHEAVTREEIHYSFDVTQQEEKDGEDLLRKAGLKNQSYIIMVPGTTRPEKTWPEDAFIETIRRLKQTTKFAIVLVGGPVDEALCFRISQASDSINLGGKTTLGSLGALLKNAELILSGDTGPMHLACAFPEVPLITLFGQTNPQLTGPIGPNSKTIIGPVKCVHCQTKKCGYPAPCMEAISSDQVLEAILRRIKK